MAAALLGVAGLPAGTLENDGVDGRWPDGKARPHKVKTKDGTIVALTDEEFDRLVLEARHRRAANPAGERKAEDVTANVGDAVTIEVLWPTFAQAVNAQGARRFPGTVVKRKPGRLDVEMRVFGMERGISIGKRAIVRVESSDDKGQVMRLVSFGRGNTVLRFAVDL